jgi:UDPglucose 6-dehydrogenase
MAKREKVCVIGAWHLGCVVSTCLADLGYSVIAVDSNSRTIESLKKGTPPLFEPGLEELINKNTKAGRLSYTTDLAKAVKGCRHILITYDIPVNENDDVNLSVIFVTARELARYLKNGSVITVMSQVPVGTCEQIRAMIVKYNDSLEFDIAYSPENLRLGQAI